MAKCFFQSKPQASSLASPFHQCPTSLAADQVSMCQLKAGFGIGQPMPTRLLCRNASSVVIEHLYQSRPVRECPQTSKQAACLCSGMCVIDVRHRRWRLSAKRTRAQNATEIGSRCRRSRQTAPSQKAQLSQHAPASAGRSGSTRLGARRTDR
ncbi:unnamed protein product [Protopolystoma xenopodis]|uniref:Uncharacterized protein n=1 Tax=Protopolystoma xenopodis TaxID=117903 RepID=A0A448X817_9PLAT|nr:unnamed protein product [Protopolystoma xenopodis]